VAEVEGFVVFPKMTVVTDVTVPAGKVLVKDRKDVREEDEVFFLEADISAMNKAIGGIAKIINDKNRSVAVNLPLHEIVYPIGLALALDHKGGDVNTT